MYLVYILKSLRDSRYCIGQTEDLDVRLQMHNNGQVKSTKSRKPFIFIKSEEYQTRSEARKRENYLKN